VDDALEIVVIPVSDEHKARRVPGPAEDRKSYGSWVSFADPDRNMVQERAQGTTT
jgi:hypothetical protein